MPALIHVARGVVGWCGIPMIDKCFACGGSFVAVEGPTHQYMASSPGCWNAYGEVLAREYENPMLFGAVHRLTVDAYALQHPGDASDRRARQSVWVHYAALYLSLRDNEDHSRIPSIMQKLTCIGGEGMGRLRIPRLGRARSSDRRDAEISLGAIPQAGHPRP